MLLITLGLLCVPVPHRTGAQQQPAAGLLAGLARGDLEPVHLTIVAARPGMLDDLNPGFRDWAERSYREALALAPQAFYCGGALAMVRYDATGFLDGHLGYFANARGTDPQLASGFKFHISSICKYLHSLVRSMGVGVALTQGCCWTARSK